LHVVLGSNDSISTTGFTNNQSTWGYYVSNGAAYDQAWDGVSGGQPVQVLARGQAPSFALVSGASNGNDTLSGTSGNNLLQGGQGNDSLTGGAGADVFKFLFNEVGTDTLTDFTKSQGDKIDLSALLSASGINTSLASSVSQYLNLTPSGSDALLKVDVDGLSNFSNPELSINLLSAWASLAPASGQSANDNLLSLLTERVFMV
jgi:Ca2+-binding RTX toxin-like protein